MVIGYQSTDLPDGVLLTNSAVKVTSDDSAIHFQPRQSRRAAGVIFLPGGMVDPDAYAPLLKNLAAVGHPAHLVRLPLRAAFLESQITELFHRISAILKANPETRWYLAGHSRGAMLASRFARESQSNIAGLILMGTTHPRDFDLSASPLQVTKIMGTHDGIATPEATRANAALLPKSTTWVEIPGANHVQFGYYRHQLLDGAPGITRAEQQAAVLKALRRALQ
jgi:pimeloyl-ACP methyl ester carboxylesterase